MRGRSRIAVVGGGISGMTAALLLARRGYSVSLYEASDSLGGLGATFEHEGTYYDAFYHVLLPTDAHLLALLDDLGMRDTVYWRQACLGFMYERALYSLASPLDLLRFSPISFSDRLRLGYTAFHVGHLSRPGPLDDIRLVDWLTRLSGRRAFAQLWEPLLKAKFGDAYDRIPALWYWASFNREKGTKKEVKGYVQGGYRGITEALLNRLRSLDVEISTGTPVERLDLDADGIPVVQTSGHVTSFDRVVTTVPLTLLANLSEGGGLDEPVRKLDCELDYQAAMNVVLLLRRSVSPYYWVPVVNSGAPFDGIVETTRTIDRNQTAGYHLVYLLNYLHRSDARYSADPEQIRTQYTSALIELIPSLSFDDIVAGFCFRRPFVEPIWTPGYLHRRPPTELVPGKVFLATTAQVYPNVTSWNSSIGVATRAVEAVQRAECGEER